MGPVPVHRREQDLPRPQLLAQLRPLDGVAAGELPAPMTEDLPSGPFGSPPRVDGEHHALRPEDLSASRDQLGLGECRGVDRHLVRAMRQQLGHVVDAAHSTADGQRDEDLVRRPFHGVEQDLSRV